MTLLLSRISGFSHMTCVCSPLTQLQHCCQDGLLHCPINLSRGFCPVKIQSGREGRSKIWKVCEGEGTEPQSELSHPGVSRSQLILMGWIWVRRRDCQEQPASCPDHLIYTENNHPKLETQMFYLKTKQNTITMILYLYKTCIPTSLPFHCVVWTEPKEKVDSMLFVLLS